MLLVLWCTRCKLQAGICDGIYTSCMQQLQRMYWSLCKQPEWQCCCADYPRSMLWGSKTPACNCARHVCMGWLLLLLLPRRQQRT
jgi:hypothetical protein